MPAAAFPRGGIEKRSEKVTSVPRCPAIVPVTVHLGFSYDKSKQEWWSRDLARTLTDRIRKWGEVMYRAESAACC